MSTYYAGGDLASGAAALAAAAASSSAVVGLSQSPGPEQQQQQHSQSQSLHSARAHPSQLPTLGTSLPTQYANSSTQPPPQQQQQQQTQQRQQQQQSQQQGQQQPPPSQPETPPTPPHHSQLQEFAAFAAQQQQHQLPFHPAYLRPQYTIPTQIAQPYYFYSMTTPGQPAFPMMVGQTGLPPTPTSTAPRDDPPPSYSGTCDGRQYTLKVVQEPIRARMCGFGDKDRRPITPPPCVLLEVLDLATNQLVDVNDIDPSYYVVSVDLWSGDGRTEVNLVRHSPTSPSISATTQSSYPPQHLPAPPYQGYPNIGHVAMQGHGQSYQYPPPADGGYGHHPAAQYHPGYDQNRGYHYPGSTPITPTSQYGAATGSQGTLVSPGAVMVTQDPRSAPGGMFTRNLIGSLSVSASKLKDTSGHLGIWFVLQDLSVRTEGTFRLKFSFVSVASSINPADPNRDRAPVLAVCYSNMFQVFSAKKFPGVIESTSLSKCFATQGIKIPIRKDGNGRVNEDDD